MSDVVWLHYSLPRTSWYELPPDQQAGHERGFEEQRTASARLGGVRNGRFHVRGQSDWSHVEIWSFPSVEHAFDHWSRLVEAGYTAFFEFSNQVGMAETAATPA